jgi:hypothetical protein
LPSTNPAADAAMPEYELSSETDHRHVRAADGDHQQHPEHQADGRQAQQRDHPDRRLLPLKDEPGDEAEGHKPQADAHKMPAGEQHRVPGDGALQLSEGHQRPEQGERADEDRAPHGQGDGPLQGVYRQPRGGRLHHVQLSGP